MDIAHAKEIPLVEILARLNIKPRRTNNHKHLYLSPVRHEKTPSFWLDTKTNRWHDYGDGRGGDPVNFACAYLQFTREDHTVPDALRWLSNMGVSLSDIVQPTYEAPVKEPGLLLKTNKPIQHLGLIHYLQKRGIPLEIAKQHLREIHVRNPHTQKSFFALGFPNEEGGHELRNPFFKGSLGPKAISFVRGSQPKPNAINLFEGGFDFLSALIQANVTCFRADTIILHSVNSLRLAIPYMQNYGYQTAYSWMDNDDAGEKATKAIAEFCQTQTDMVHRPMNKLYTPHKDINAWHMHQRNLTL